MTDKPRILIVDDVASNIHLLMSVLKDSFTLTAATNGEKALSLAQMEPKPDLILLDIVMPGLDGYEVCKQLKSSEQTKDIPVIFVTSLNSIEEQEKGLEVGGVDFITKPFSKAIVLHKIKTHIVSNKEKRLPKRDEQRVLNEKDMMMNTTKQTILVVDDSPENIQVMIEVLKSDYTVSVATSGKKALQLLEEGLVPDLILLDIIMPEMDGYELCAIIKKREAYSRIPIVFVTILENEKDIVRGFELGAIDYVIKPIEPIVLKTRVKNHLKLKNFQDKLIEDLHTKEELLFKQSKMAVLGEMFENITHQWKQPLSTINVVTSGIKLDKEYDKLTDEKLFNCLDTIDLSVKYLSHTVDDFRNFIDNDTQRYSFNLKEVVDKTLKLLESKFQTSSIEIENNLEDFNVLNYKNDLIQVFMNLFSNAYDALIKKEMNRKLFIRMEKEQNRVIICVEDNAGGIDEKLVETIFDKYITTKKESVGSGLGLFMSQKIVNERLCGEINVHNTNRGACFEIALPL